MVLYRLDPLSLDDPRWQASSVAESVWVAAATAARARQLVAEQTLRSTMSLNGSKLSSPWLSDSLSRCALAQSTTDVPVGTVMFTGDERIVSTEEAE